MQGALAGGCECYSRLAGSGHCFAPSRRDRRALNKGARRRRGPALYDSATPCLAHNGHLHCAIQPHRTACYLGVQVLPQRGYTLAVVSLLQYRLVAWKHATPIDGPTSKDSFYCCAWSLSYKLSSPAGCVSYHGTVLARTLFLCHWSAEQWCGVNGGSLDGMLLQSTGQGKDTFHCHP